jgi:hypothetical protein
VSDRQKHEYERHRAAIYERLRHRPDFDRVMDSALIDLAARLFADWLYVEGILSSPEGRYAVSKYADASRRLIAC